MITKEQKYRGFSRIQGWGLEPETYRTRDMFGPRDFASWEFKTNQTRTKTMPVTVTVSTFHFRYCKMMPFDNRAEEASFRLGLQGEHTGFFDDKGEDQSQRDRMVSDICADP